MAPTGDPVGAYVKRSATGGGHPADRLARHRNGAEHRGEFLGRQRRRAVQPVDEAVVVGGALAQDLVAGYAQSGKAPALPAGAVALRVSAGYATFAETFSGWRNSPPDAAAIATKAAARAGLGVTYDADSTYGVYWVLVLDD